MKETSNRTLNSDIRGSYPHADKDIDSEISPADKSAISASGSRDAGGGYSVESSERLQRHHHHHHGNNSDEACNGNNNNNNNNSSSSNNNNNNATSSAVTSATTTTTTTTAAAATTSSNTYNTAANATTSNSTTTTNNGDDGSGSDQPRVTPYERLSQDLSHDQRVIKEITLGRRIAFYRIRGEIGSGNFSQVKLGIHALTKEKVAIKILDKTKLDLKTQRLLSREILSMECLHHPNIIRLYEVVETLAKLHIVMEYAGGGELFTKISNEGRLPELEAKCIFAQLVAAIDHMHNNHIIHRDLKAENVFYANSKWIKVGDFGFSTISRTNETLNTFCGSPPYAAPELFKDEHYYGVFVDIWALGILLYFIVTGLMPFRAETVAKLKKCILDGSYTVPSYISDSCVFLIRSILKHIPQDRFTIAEIKRSEWLEGEEFPGALKPYNLNPNFEASAAREEEQEAKHILNNLGIKEEHFKQTSIRDSRNSVTGTYRIVLHRVQKKNAGLYEPFHETVERDYNLNERRSRKTPPSKISSHHKPQSKTCSIL